MEIGDQMIQAMSVRELWASWNTVDAIELGDGFHAVDCVTFMNDRMWIETQDHIRLSFGVDEVVTVMF